MNEIFENNKFTTRAHNFYNLYRTPIIAIVVILLITVVLFLAIGQISKSNNEKAAEIYNKWTLQEIETEDGQKGVAVISVMGNSWEDLRVFIESFHLSYEDAIASIKQYAYIMD